MLVTKFIEIAQTSTVLARYISSPKLAELITLINAVACSECTTPRKIVKSLSKTALCIINNRDFKCPQQYRQCFKEAGILERSLQDECYVQLALLAGHQPESIWSN